jgi:hypothetical protein
MAGSGKVTLYRRTGQQQWRKNATSTVFSNQNCDHHNLPSVTLPAGSMLSYRAWHEYERLRTNDPPEVRAVEMDDGATHRGNVAGRRNGFTPAPVDPHGSAGARPGAGFDPAGRTGGPHAGRSRRGVRRLARAVVLESVLAAVLTATFARGRCGRMSGIKLAARGGRR